MLVTPATYRFQAEGERKRVQGEKSLSRPWFSISDIGEDHADYPFLAKGHDGLFVIGSPG